MKFAPVHVQYSPDGQTLMYVVSTGSSRDMALTSRRQVVLRRWSAVLSREAANDRPQGAVEANGK